MDSTVAKRATRPGYPHRLVTAGRKPERHLATHVFNVAVLAVGVSALVWMLDELGWQNVRRVLRGVGGWFALIVAFDLATLACEAGAIPISPEGFEAIRGLLERPLVEATGTGISERGRRDALSVVESSYEYHGGFRLRTTAQGA